MEAVDHIEMRILSQPRYCCVVRAAVESIAAKLGMPEQKRHRLALAVDEAITNAIRHGYHEQPDQPIWIRMTPYGDNGTAGLQIVIEDRSVGVDIDQIKDRVVGRDQESEVTPGGLGVHIIHQAADEVRFEKRTDGDGLRLTLRASADGDANAEPSADRGT